MNIQGMMKQAKKIQSEISTVKKEVNETVFTNENEILVIEMYGNKRIKRISFKEKDIDAELLEDMLLIQINKLIKEIESETESKLGKFGPALNGIM